MVKGTKSVQNKLGILFPLVLNLSSQNVIIETLADNLIPQGGIYLRVHLTQSKTEVMAPNDIMRSPRLATGITSHGTIQLYETINIHLSLNRLELNSLSFLTKRIQLRQTYRGKWPKFKHWVSNNPNAQFVKRQTHLKCYHSYKILLLFFFKKERAVEKLNPTTSLDHLNSTGVIYNLPYSFYLSISLLLF